MAPSRGKSRIRKSADKDLQIIRTWLTDQDARNIPGTFFCNWDLTEKSHKEGKLLVYIDGASGQPVAYQWGGLVHPGILEVRHDMRGRGIGSKLVRHRIAQARRHNECFLHIQCKPSSSIPFWQRMGFTLLGFKEDENYAYRILEKKHQLPRDGVPIDVSIRFFPEDRKWGKKVSAYSVATPKAIQKSDGIVHLAERVFFFSKLHPDSRDPVVEIEVAAQIRVFDKAKYPKARDIGVQRCDYGFYLDRIFPES